MKPISPLTSFPEFANINPGVQPGDPKYSQGFVPSDTFPAEWANYLFNRSSKGITTLNEAVNSIWAELGSILTYYNITPDSTKTDQLLDALKKIPAHFTNCQSAANAETKVIAVQDDVLKAGNVYVIDMTNGNTYGDGSATYPKLSINSGTAYPLCDANGQYLASGAWAAGNTIKVIFTGTKFLMSTRAPVDAVTNGDKSPVTSNAVYQLISNQFNIMWPVGVTYTQYPGQKDPNELWGAYSTWEELNYGGAFFRTPGGEALDFNASLTISSRNGTTLEFTSAHGLQVGSILYDSKHNEVRKVVSVTNTTTVVLDNGFTYSDYTNVLINQYDQIQNITGSTKFSATSKGETGAFSSSPYAWAAPANSGYSMTLYFDSSRVVRAGTETRSSNFTYKIWKRTA